jgi:hypothetical protein
MLLRDVAVRNSGTSVAVSPDNGFGPRLTLDMPSNLATYVHDHLAGAQFAIELLQDLSEKASDRRITELAAALLPEIESDRSALQRFAEAIGEEPSGAKESAAWLTQKLSRVKLSAADDLGAFEAVETLSLGILGKLALWNSIKILPKCDAAKVLKLSDLLAAAENQHTRVEHLRRELASHVLTTEK